MPPSLAERGHIVFVHSVTLSVCGSVHTFADYFRTRPEIPEHSRNAKYFRTRPEIPEPVVLVRHLGIDLNGGFVTFSINKLPKIGE